MAGDLVVVGVHSVVPPGGQDSISGRPPKGSGSAECQGMYEKVGCFQQQQCPRGPAKKVECGCCYEIEYIPQSLAEGQEKGSSQIVQFVGTRGDGGGDVRCKHLPSIICHRCQPERSGKLSFDRLHADSLNNRGGLSFQLARHGESNRASAPTKSENRFVSQFRLSPTPCPAGTVWQELRDLVSEHKPPEKIVEDPMQAESLASSGDMESRGGDQRYPKTPPRDDDPYERMNIPRLPILPEVFQFSPEQRRFSARPSAVAASTERYLRSAFGLSCRNFENQKCGTWVF